METERALPTCGQLERQLSQTLQALYRKQFGHLPSKISCHLFGNRLAIIIENAITSIEQILVNNSQPDLAKSIRSAINEVFTAKIQQEIANILGVKVTDIIIDSVLDSGYLGIIVFLDNSPPVRIARKNLRK